MMVKQYRILYLHYKLSIIAIFTTFLLCGFNFAAAQEIPFLVNFPKSKYSAAQQNWGVSQDKEGNMYFANTGGLLKYDGVRWKLFPLKEEKIIRSVLAVGNRVYTGAYGEFGYWQKTGNAEMKYYSLAALIKDKKFANEEIWHILQKGNNIFFQSFGAMYCYDGKDIKQIKIPSTIMFAVSVGDEIYLPTIGSGIHRLVGDGFELIPNTQVFNQSILTGILAIDDNTLLIATNEDGAYLFSDNKIRSFDAPINDLLKKHQINKVAKSGANTLLFATISDGLYTYDTKTGHSIHINKNKGLQNNTILSLFIDKSQGIWLGLDKGISYLDLNSEFKYFFDNQENLGTIYTMANIGNTKYIGTNQGLYSYTEANVLEQRYFKNIAGISGQVWDLLKIDNDIICGHNTGTHLITTKGIKKISSTNGGWHTIPIPGRNDLLLQATYTGLIVLSKAPEWQYSYKVEGLSEAIERIIAVDAFTYWLCGPIGNLKKIKLSKDYKKIVEVKNYDAINSGLPSIHKIQIAKVDGNVFVHSNEKQYRYDTQKDKFVLFSNDNFAIRNPRKDYLFHTYSDSIVQLSPVKKTYAKRVRSDYNSIIDIGNQLVFLGDDNYIVKKTESDTNAYKAEILPLKVTGAYLYGSKQYVSNAALLQPLKYEDNTFDLYFMNPYYKDNVLYKYTLEGPQNESTTWKDIDMIAIKNLKPGNYVLTIVSSLNQKAKVRFTIKPQWYLSSWMWMIYICLGASIVYFYKKKFEKDIKIKMLKFEEENARQLREHKIALDNEKLKEDNLHKSRELANATLELIKKNEILEEIKEELIEIRKKDEAMTPKDFQKMMKQINDNLTSDHDNQLFESNFSEVHDVFFKKLLALYPELTPQDLKLAAFLKMNLSTKEIAPLFNISVRGLENKRYRLRRKLNLDNEVNLTEFFIKLD